MRLALVGIAEFGTWLGTRFERVSRSPGLAGRGYTAIAHYVIGFAIQRPVDETADPERASRLRDHYRSLDARIYPASTIVADVLPGATIDEEFEFGLSLIIDGLENALRTTTRTDTKSHPHGHTQK